MAFLTAQTAFYYLATASVASAILAVTRRNPVHSMLWVLALFLHVAGIFLLLDAEFLAAVQVIVYAGAILVFYIFVVMLLDLPGEEARPRFGKHWPLAAVVGLSFASLAWLAQDEPFQEVGSGVAPAAKQLATDGPVGPAAATCFASAAIPAGSSVSTCASQARAAKEAPTPAANSQWAPNRGRASSPGRSSSISTNK